MSGVPVALFGGSRRRRRTYASFSISSKMKALFVTMICLMVLFLTVSVSFGNPSGSRVLVEIGSNSTKDNLVEIGGDDVADLKTLRLVQVLFRHGDRTPIDRYPNDPYNSHQFWPEGWGKLTERGKLMQFRLGQYIRKRYDGFLSNVYTAQEIYVQSSDYDRTIMSAEANLAGLWPATQKQNEDLPLGARQQFVPVHSISGEVDNKISYKKSCPKYDKKLGEIKLQEVEKEYNAKYEQLYKELTTLTGLNVTSYFNVSDIYDDLFVQQSHNFTLPLWTKDYFPDKMKPLIEHWIQVYTHDKEMRIMRSGPLITEFVRNMKRKVSNPSEQEQEILEKLLHTPYVKFYMYSGHDTTLSAILDGLGVFDGIIPPYAASVYLELHQKEGKDGEYFVKVFYRPNYEKPTIELNLTNCKSNPCLFFDFVEMLNEYILEEHQWQQLCKV